MSETAAPTQTLVSLASKQVWQQLLVWKALRPSRILLLHSSDHNESKAPAERLQSFLKSSGLCCECEAVPHDDYDGILAVLDQIVARHSLTPAGTILNFTGGNKLMATAAFQWAATRGIQSCYLERGNQLFRFEVSGGMIHSKAERLDSHSCDGLGALDIIKCQLDTAVIERAGELLSLNDAGRNRTEKEFIADFSSNPDRVVGYLIVADCLSQKQASGDPMEFLAAAVLLKLGVASVRRSVRIRPTKMIPLPGDPPLENEFDLVFNYGGRLWVADCKDRKSPENLATGVERTLRSLKNSPLHLHHFKTEWAKLKAAVTASPMKIMKEDILAAQALGGLLGQVICVRKSEPSPEIVNFARSKGIHVVTRSRLIDELKDVPGLFNSARLPA